MYTKNDKGPKIDPGAHLIVALKGLFVVFELLGCKIKMKEI